MAQDRQLEVAGVDISAAELVNMCRLGAPNPFVLQHDVTDFFPRFVNRAIPIFINKDFCIPNGAATAAAVFIGNNDRIVCGDRGEEFYFAGDVVDVIVLSSKLRVKVTLARPFTALIVAYNAIINEDLFTPLFDG